MAPDKPAKLLAEWFWADRWMGSSAFALPLEARGLYREMLTAAWRRGASLPNDHEAIRRLAGITEKEWRRCWPAVERFWRVDGDRLVNDTQVEVYADAEARAFGAQSRAQKGAASRWNGKSESGDRFTKLQVARAKGTHTEQDWFDLLGVVGKTCGRCGTSDNVIKDHIVPLSFGGSDGLENIQPLCVSCNSQKGSDTTDYRLRIPRFRQWLSTAQALLKQCPPSPSLSLERTYTHIPRARGTLFGPEHRAHAACGRVCVPAFLHREFRLALGGDEDRADQQLRDWYEAVLGGLSADPVESDGVKFWRPQFALAFVKPTQAQRVAVDEQAAIVAEIERQNAAVRR